jgi:putative holliday junction resolvase
MRYLGLDPGSARLGVALSDSNGSLALPLETIPRDARGADLRRVAEIVAARGVERIVVGLPLTLAGETGPAAEVVNQFVAALREAVTVEVVTWDERLTSAQVEKAMAGAGMSERDRRGRVDAAAAALILQSYLDAHEQQPSE